MFSDDMNLESSKESITRGTEKAANGNLSRQSSVMTDTSNNQEYSHFVLRKKKSSLRLGKKVYEFYNAPITKFWFYTVSSLLPFK